MSFTPPGVDDWISAQTAAKLLGVRVQTVYKMLDTGQLYAAQGARPVGAPDGPRGHHRHARLRRADVEDFLERARIKPGELRAAYLRAIGRRPGSVTDGPP